MNELLLYFAVFAAAFVVAFFAGMAALALAALVDHLVRRR